MGDSTIEQIVRAFCVQLGEQARLMTGVAQTVTEESDGTYMVGGNDVLKNIVVGFRRADKNLQSEPPRIVFVVSGSQILTPDRPGAQKVHATLESRRQIRRRIMRVEVFFWGETLEESESLLTNSMRALESFHNAVQYESETWDSQQENKGGVSDFGYELSLVVLFDIQVFDKPEMLFRKNLTTVQHFAVQVTELDQTEVITK